VTGGQLPQRAGSLGLNGGGAAAAVPLLNISNSGIFRMCEEGVQLGTEVPHGAPGAKGGLWDEIPQKLKLFVNKCLKFDVLEEKH